MLITAIVFVVLSAGLVVSSGLNSRELVANKLIRRLVVLGSIVAAVLGGLLIVETAWPAEPTAEGELTKAGDVIELGAVTGGVLQLECKMLEGVNKPGLSLIVRMVVEGKDGKQNTQATFQVGDSTEDMDNLKTSHMATNIALNGVGDGARITLTKVSNDGIVSVQVAYRPSRFPFQTGLIALFVMVGLAAVFEGAAPPGWRRSFLTVTIASVAMFVWLLKDGLTSEDSVWTLWTRIAYAIAAGAVAGTLLPVVVGWFMPTLKAPPRKGTGPAPASDESPGS